MLHPLSLKKNTVFWLFLRTLLTLLIRSYCARALFKGEKLKEKGQHLIIECRKRRVNVFVVNPRLFFLVFFWGQGWLVFSYARHANSEGPRHLPPPEGSRWRVHWAQMFVCEYEHILFSKTKVWRGREKLRNVYTRDLRLYLTKGQGGHAIRCSKAAVKQQ